MFLKWAILRTNCVSEIGYFTYKFFLLAENKKRRVEATEIDVLRRSSRISRKERIRNVTITQQIELTYLRLRDTFSRNTPPRRSEWGSSLPPDCFVSRGSISHG
jgi:hypothetical protein